MPDPRFPDPAADGELPPVVSFAPAHDVLPPELELAAAPARAVVLLLAAPAQRGWAADVAVALASAWAQAGRRVVLADLHLEEPRLHERLGEENADGLVDIFLYGASLARSARPVRGRGFHLIPSGTYTADVEALFRHPRWGKLVAGFREAHASLLLFVPADAPGLAELAGWAEEALVLGDASDAARLPALPLRAVVRPPDVMGSADAFPAAGPSDAADADDEWATAAALRPAWPAAEASAPLGMAPPVETEALPGPAAEVFRGQTPAAEPEAELEPAWAAAAARTLVPPPPPARRRRVAPLAWAIGAVVVLAVAAFALALMRPELFGRGRAGAAADSVPAAVPARPAPAPVPVGTALPYAVALQAFETPAAARQQAGAEAERLAGSSVYIVPIDNNGRLFYRVLAGSLPDTASVRALRARLVELGTIPAEDAAGEWSRIHFGPLAYDLGEFASSAAAQTRADSLWALGLPSYAVPEPYSDHSERWHLYVGAFRDSAAAVGVDALLRQHGLSARLVERRGRGDVLTK